MDKDKIIFEATMFKRIEKYPHLFASKCGKIYSEKSNRILKQSNQSNGYLVIGVYDASIKNAKMLLVHRLIASAWIGLDLDKDTAKIVIDHINNDKKDNRVKNLRITTSRFNTTRGMTNKHGYTGVSKDNNEFGAYINILGLKIYLGVYKTPEQAHARYNVAKMVSRMPI